MFVPRTSLIKTTGQFNFSRYARAPNFLISKPCTACFRKAYIWVLNRQSRIIWKDIASQRLFWCPPLHGQRILSLVLRSFLALYPVQTFDILPERYEGCVSLNGKCNSLKSYLSLRLLLTCSVSWAGDGECDGDRGDTSGKKCTNW